MNRYEKWLWCTCDKAAWWHLIFIYRQMITDTLRKTTIPQQQTTLQTAALLQHLFKCRQYCNIMTSTSGINLVCTIRSETWMFSVLRYNTSRKKRIKQDKKKREVAFPTAGLNRSLQCTENTEIPTLSIQSWLSAHLQVNGLLSCLLLSKGTSEPVITALPVPTLSPCK